MKKLTIPVTIYFEDDADVTRITGVADAVIRNVDDLYASMPMDSRIYVSMVDYDDDAAGASVQVAEGEERPCLTCFYWDCVCEEEEARK
jgi:hypothetical protein